MRSADNSHRKHVPAGTSRSLNGIPPSSNLTYAQAELLEDDNRPPDSIKGGWVAHANLIWSVTDEMRTGIEYMWGERENTSGDTGNADRVQWTIQYFF